MANSQLDVPTGPGLGVDIDESSLKDLGALRRDVTVHR